MKVSPAVMKSPAACGKFYSAVLNSPLLSVLIQINPVHALSSYFRAILILPSHLIPYLRSGFPF